MKKAREIKKRILLKGKLRQINATDFAALFGGLVQAITDPKVGFNHATTDIDGWFQSVAPYGLTIDEAFVEDLLYSCNMLAELGKFRHPQNKTFEEMLKVILKPNESFDTDTNEIRGKQ